MTQELQQVSVLLPKETIEEYQKRGIKISTHFRDFAEKEIETKKEGTIKPQWLPYLQNAAYHVQRNPRFLRGQYRGFLNMFHAENITFEEFDQMLNQVEPRLHIVDDNLKLRPAIADEKQQIEISLRR